MDSRTAQTLIKLNHQFYQTFGKDFSATRRRIQPGVRRIISALDGTERLLDLGCGNGELARELARSGFRGEYTGMDFSPPLLEDASDNPQSFPVNFLQADLASPNWASLFTFQFSLITCFATLHHIPSEPLRLQFLRQVRALLAPGGRFILSNWQFLSSERLRVRIQPWSLAGLADADVDPGDHLLDWRAGGQGLRYAHHFSEDELAALAAQSGFNVAETFYSDGEQGRLGLYQVWRAE